MSRNGGKQENGKDERPLQENWIYQGNISCKMGTIKDRNSVDLTEAEDIKEVARIHRTVQKRSS